MKRRQAPDLFRLSDEELQAFWMENDPTEIDRLGDHLLAEALPRRARPSSLTGPADQLIRQREAAGLSLEELARRWALNPGLLEAWESDRLAAPPSLFQLYQKLTPAG